MADHAVTLAALQDLLVSIQGSWVTKKLGVPHQPNPLQPWQRGTLMPGQPDPVGFGDGRYSRTWAIFQVDLYYPAKTTDVRSLVERAELVRDTFYPNRKAFAIGDAVVDRLPKIGALVEDDGGFLKIQVDVPLYMDDSN